MVEICIICFFFFDSIAWLDKVGSNMYNVIVAYKQIREQVTNSQGSASSQIPKVKPNQRINHKIEPMRKHVQNTSHQIIKFPLHS